MSYCSRMANVTLVITVTSWILVAAALMASFLVRRLRAAWLRWLFTGLLLGNSAGLIDQFAQDRHWPWHQQLVVSGVALMLAVAGLVVMVIAFSSYFRRNKRISCLAHISGQSC
jgi:hypothetical protein